MRITYALVASLLCSTAYADNDSIGSGGANAVGLLLPNGMPLNGAGMGIGQAEGTRPGKPGFDDPAHSALLIIPDGVYRQGGSVTANEVWIGNHAEGVAGIMISQDSRALGIAPQAQLHSSASAATGQRNYAQAAYHVAKRTTTSGQPINAINMSFGLALTGGEDINGNSHLTSFVDWSAAKHDILYVVAGRETVGGDGPVPSDNYNGITVAASDNAGSFNGVFDNTWSQNDYSEDAEGDRVSIDLLAPGVLIDTIDLGNGLANPVTSGTSNAAPHVTGAVALLQQYAKFQIDANEARWNENARRHELMKAILLNSADKLNFVHDSTRTIFNENGQKWDQTLAHSDPATPLDEQMGAGHLNVGSALTNYKSGEYDPGIVPRIGWDYSPISDGATDYILNESVSTESWIAVTLTWDRIVTSSEVGDTYNTGTSFFNNNIEDELVDLDLYLLDGNDNIVTSSVAVNDSVEHIFWQVPAGDDFKIRVVNAGGGNGEANGYALAWWAGEVNSIDGDFDGDGDVDQADLTKWKNEFGTNYDGNDFLAWQRNFGFGVPATPASAAVPEPSALMLSMLGLPFLMRRQR